MFIKKGDTVKVISGNSKGKTGKVLNILIKSDKVVVEGVNIVSRHTKPSNANPDGGIIKKEAPIAISNVQLVDTKKDNIASKVGMKIVDGKKVRYFKKTGNVLDK
ncbi:MAG: 50S ribosomal protein L24 [Bacilli bacterium]|jgi:large subunit ribosomal protein L24|nr:50S ribosomal protein L24 [Bacilli bacterium]MDD2681635.1 50S ribosomal protein L24 [Bacilli bacterium]MDD3120970.1 50S ribosomal protein L24 [Bacilli bacterium]MDD4063144.1 50S ribosomal protein L24 [Bacilli bacterium]MDD4481784.1 50S ribosomal protein L24 [Bacilli bacterium]